MSVALPPDAVSLADLAKERGVSGQAIRKRVSKFEREGLLTAYGTAKGKFVSKAAFDFAVQQAGDPVKEAAAETAAILRSDDGELPLGDPVQSAPASGEAPVYRDAKAKNEYYSAEMQRLKFESLNGQLYRREEVEAAVQRLAGAVKEVTKGLASRADEAAEALEKGMPQFRRWLGNLGDDICRALAAEWRVKAVAVDIEEPGDDGDPDETEDKT